MSAPSGTEPKTDSIPELVAILSEINIPVQIGLRPLYTIAEKNIDTLYTSPGYPDKWIYDGCATRYKYTFHRGPLQLKANGNNLNLSFTGYYKVIGSTRACIHGTPISPWTAPCQCGFAEGERKVNVSFASSFYLQSDYKVRVLINRLEPQPLNKCEVCFWGQDITTQVMNQLKSDLDDAKKNIEQAYSLIDLRPKFQQMWDQLNKSYNVYGLGWLQIHPEQVRINSMFSSNDSLNIFIGLSARPVISFEKPVEQTNTIPDITRSPTAPGINIFLDAVLQYDSLSAILNDQISGQQFDVGNGVVKKKFIIRSCNVLGSGNENILLKVDFSGSADGTAYLTGKPVYNSISHILEIKDLDFDIKTRDKLLKSASWIFNKKITDEISSYSKFDLSSFIDSSQSQLNQLLNKQWIPGVQAYGNISDINLIGIFPLNKNLVLRSKCSGLLSLQINPAEISF